MPVDLTEISPLHLRVHRVLNDGISVDAGPVVDAGQVIGDEGGGIGGDAWANAGLVGDDQIEELDIDGEDEDDDIEDAESFAQGEAQFDNLGAQGDVHVEGIGGASHRHVNGQMRVPVPPRYHLPTSSFYSSFWYARYVRTCRWMRKLWRTLTHWSPVGEYLVQLYVVCTIFSGFISCVVETIIYQAVLFFLPQTISAHAGCPNCSLANDAQFLRIVNESFAYDASNALNICLNVKDVVLGKERMALAVQTIMNSVSQTEQILMRGSCWATNLSLVGEYSSISSSSANHTFSLVYSLASLLDLSGRQILLYIFVIKFATFIGLTMTALQCYRVSREQRMVNMLLLNVLEQQLNAEREPSVEIIYRLLHIHSTPHIYTAMALGVFLSIIPHTSSLYVYVYSGILYVLAILPLQKKFRVFTNNSSRSLIA